MAPAAKKYQQPYSSRHVQQNTRDSIRSQEPPYIKNFPRFLHIIYNRQTPYNSAILAATRGAVKSAGKSRGSRSPSGNGQDSRRRSPSEKSITTRNQQQQEQQPAQQDPQQSSGFKTLGAKAKSPTAAISTMPSDFEHIFHYSETQ